MITYSGEKYIATYVADAGQRLAKLGEAIVPGCLKDEECDEMNNGMWSMLEYLT